MNRLIALLAVAFLTFGSEQDKQPSEEDLGTWRVGRLLYYDRFALSEGLTRAQARAKLGSTLVITKSGIARLGTQPCDEGRVMMTVEKSDLLRVSKLLPPPGESLNLGLPDRVTIFNYGCIELWLKADGHMIAPSDAYYFELTRYRERTRLKARTNRE